MIRSSAQDRLYLSQEDGEDIYIDTCRIPPHHIEGIRFLFKQFKRNNLGVIINDPFGFGRNIQIILFLKAIRSLLDKPVLILCQDGEDWLDRIYTWTDMYDEVVIDTANLAIRKLIFINTMVNLPMYTAKEWSIVVVDGEKNTAIDQILRLSFMADFKIWNTPVNMKENLDNFEEIYQWLYPREIFEKHYFIPNADSAVDVIEKAILLDSFMEDIVLRRDDLNSSFEKYQRDVVMPPPKSTTVPSIAPSATVTMASSVTTPTTVPTAPPPVSKKNKDATGTKIKRSKTRIEAEAQNKPYEPPVAAMSQQTGESSTYAPYESSEDFSIDNYKRKIKETDKQKESQFKIIEIDNSDNRSNLKLYYEPDSAPPADKLEEMDTLVFGHDTFISKVSDVYQQSEKANKTFSKTDITVTRKPMSQQMTNKPSTDTAEKSDRVAKGTNKSPNKIEGNIGTPSDVGIKGVYHGPKHAQTTKIKDDSDKMNLDELNKEISDLDKATSKVSGNQRVKLNTNERNKTSDMNTDTEQVANSLKRNNIDDKMKECEESVSKKFKGSFLDSLF